MGAAQQSSGSPPAKARPGFWQNIGQFALYNERGESETLIKGDAVTFNLTGPDLRITTARYDIAAPHITLVVRNGQVQTGTAAGGVHVEVRNPEQKLTTTLTCDAADYV